VCVCGCVRADSLMYMCALHNGWCAKVCACVLLLSSVSSLVSCHGGWCWPYQNCNAIATFVRLARLSPTSQTMHDTHCSYTHRVQSVPSAPLTYRIV